MGIYLTMLLTITCTELKINPDMQYYNKSLNRVSLSDVLLPLYLVDHIIKFEAAELA